MKTLYVLALALFLNLTVSAQVADTLVMLWNDEFNGAQLDNSKWGACPEWHRQGGSYWEGDNAWVDGNGNLKLKVTERNDSVFCGAVRTHNKYNQKYGYFEVRCKVPQIHGGWAAFWLMPYGNQPGSWGNDGTEMDVFESINGWNGKIQHALHWDGYGAQHQKDSKSMTDWGLYDGKFHIFGMMWTPTEYVFYIDNVETWRTTAGGISDVEQYLKLTMEVSSGTWPGDWNNQTTIPITWAIDYVRTYAYDIKKPDLSITKPTEAKTIDLGNEQTVKAVVAGDFDYLDSIEFYELLDGGSEVLFQTRTIGSNSDEIFYAGWTPSTSGNYEVIVKGIKDGAVLTSDTVNVVVQDIVSGIDSDGRFTTSTFYPNPSAKTILFTKAAQLVEVYNSIGEQVIVKENVSELNVDFLPKGHYLVVVNKEAPRNLIVK